MRSGTLICLFATALLAACSSASKPGNLLTRDMTATSSALDAAVGDMPTPADMKGSDMRRGMTLDLAHDVTPPDLSTPYDLASHDLATTSTDMATSSSSGQIGCDNLSYCYGTCWDITFTTSDFIDCVSYECDPYQTSHGSDLFDVALQCVVDDCVSALRCSSVNDNSSDCIACQINGRAGLLYLYCDNPADPACDVSSCSQTVTECHADQDPL